MRSDLTFYAGPLLSLAGTYWLHATLTLVAAWLLLALSHRSWSLQERVWRWATIIPFVTTAAAFMIAEDSIPVKDTLPEPVVATPPRRVESTASPSIERPFDEQSTTDIDMPEEVEPATASRFVLSFDDDTPDAQVRSTPAVPLIRSKEVHSSTPSPQPALTPATRSLPEDLTIPLQQIPSGVTISSAALILSWTLIGFGRLLVALVRSHRLLRRMEVVRDGPLVMLLEELRTAHGFRRRVRLLQTDVPIEPAASGVWSWTIVVSADLESQLPVEEQRAALTHELAHLVRGDVVWLWIGRLLTLAFGWQPLNRLAVRRWREASEHLCDDWTTARSVEPMTLAKCLTRVAEWKLQGATPDAALTLGGRRSLLAARIERLTGPRQPDSWQSPLRRRTLTVGLLLTTGLLIWTGPHITWATSDASPGDSSASAELTRISSKQPDSQESNPDMLDPSVAASADVEELGDLDALRHDLAYALDLLAETEADDEVTALVTQIRNRLDALATPTPQQE